MAGSIPEIAELKSRHGFRGLLQEVWWGKASLSAGHQLDEAERRAFSAIGKRRLWLDCREPCVLIPAQTGVVYHTQAGGTGCLQMYLEGFLLPLGARVQDGGPFDPAGNYLRWSDRPEEYAAAVAAANESGCMSIHDFKVIDDEDNAEAWLWIEGRFRDSEEQFFCVLTWMNSD